MCTRSDLRRTADPERKMALELVTTKKIEIGTTNTSEILSKKSSKRSKFSWVKAKTVQEVHFDLRPSLYTEESDYEKSIKERLILWPIE